MGWLSWLGLETEPKNFDFADIVGSIETHSEVRDPLLAILSLEEKQRVAALRTLIHRSEEMGAPRRLLICLDMLRDPLLSEEVRNALRKE